MPKQVWKIERFDGGLNTNSDPRDIADNELADATDIMVDNVGKIRTLGGTATHGEVGAVTHAVEAGYGMFQFSHDRLGAEKVEHSGRLTGGNSDTVLIDSGAAFTDGLVGGTVYNLTDGSTGKVKSVDSGTQITVDDF